MNRWIVALVALIAGAGLALQVGFNSTLRARAGHPFHAALLSFVTGTGLVVVLSWSVRGQWAPWAEMSRGPWWMWLGGATGVLYVASAAALAHRLGSAAWLAAVITGQLATSLVLDHFGLVGFAAQPISGVRVAGAVLLLCGVYLLLK